MSEIEIEIAPLETILESRRAEIRAGVIKLRRRSHDCADLAASSVTPEGKHILSTMASDLGKEADELETRLAVIGQVHREKGAAASPNLER